VFHSCRSAATQGVLQFGTQISGQQIRVNWPKSGANPPKLIIRTVIQGADQHPRAGR
jgi:hypothetical protein